MARPRSHEDDGEPTSDQADQAKPHPSLARGTAFVGSLQARHKVAHDMRKLDLQHFVRSSTRIGCLLQVFCSLFAAEWKQPHLL